MADATDRTSETATHDRQSAPLLGSHDHLIEHEGWVSLQHEGHLDLVLQTGCIVEAHSLNTHVWTMGCHLLQRLDDILGVVKVQELKVWQLLLGKVQPVLLVVNQNDLLGATNVGALGCQDADCIRNTSPQP